MSVLGNFEEALNFVCTSVFASVTYIYIERERERVLLSHKKNEIMPFAATRMGLEMVILSEVSQTEKDII